MSAVIFTNPSTQAFVYAWIHTPTLKWYVGSRTAQGCHPEDGYICSSRQVLPLVESQQDQWRRVIIAQGDPEHMLELETMILETLDAKNDPRSYNQHNGDGRFTTTGTVAWNKGLKKPRGTPSWNSGKPNPKHSAKMKGRKAPNKGVPMSEEQKLKISAAHKGKPSPKKGKPGKALSPESKNKISRALKGTKQSVEWIEKRIAGKRGKPNHKVSEALKGRSKSDQHRANLSKSLTGKPSKRKGVANPKLREYMLANPKQKTVCRLFDQKEMFYGNFLQWERLESVKTKGS